MARRPPVKKKKAARKARSRILHEREPCIGCGACAAVFPEAWVLEADGKATLVGSRGTGDGVFALEAPSTLRHKEAASVCPVCLIRIEPP